MNFSRRAFVKNGGLALMGFSALPPFLTRAVAAGPSNTGGRKILVVLFQRGAADGLNIVVPFAEKNYYAMRPTLAIPAPHPLGEGDANTAALDLDGFFGLHPALAPLQPMFQKQQLAIVHAAGSPDTTRSHFDAQDYMESGTPGVKSTRDGWLNRAIQELHDGNDSAFRAVALGQNLPRMLQGKAAAVAVPDLRTFQVQGAPSAAGGFEAIYAQTVDKQLGDSGRETFDAIGMLRKADPSKYQPDNGSEYPHQGNGQGTRFGQALQQIAQLIKSNVGLEVAFADAGGWDTHVNQGNAQGQLANLLREMGQSLAAFHKDMGDRMEDIVVVTMSEFGRTAKENGNRGTDHGHANCMFVMGGDVKGGRVYGQWPGLAPEQLNEGRDLALTTDFRTVLSEVLVKHQKNDALKQIFPGFTADPRKYLNLIKA
jgi:uncharacterized protein (DUF1501 family)